MFKELLEKLRYGVAVTEGEAAIYRKWRREQGYLYCRMSKRIQGINSEGLMNVIMNDMMSLFDKIKKLESKECPFSPPRAFKMPEGWPPEVNQTQYYCYDYYGNGWYMRMFFGGHTEWLRLAEEVTTQQWLNIYPLPMDIDYQNEFEKK